MAKRSANTGLGSGLKGEQLYAFQEFRRNSSFPHFLDKVGRGFPKHSQVGLG